MNRAPAAARAIAPAAKTIKADEKNRQRVLVVDDDVPFREALTERFFKDGVRTINCGKLSDALWMLQNQKFELILLDLNLVQGSGERILETLRAEKSHLNFQTPVIVVSGTLNLSLIKRLAGQVAGIFVKPFEYEKLLNLVQAICPAVPVSAPEPQQK